ncbi:MAG: RICIN domain-containing protein [Oscillospiraceae bacterium]|nr:RICIN domain-containing protein [Oscillospiraceae bacterium]
MKRVMALIIALAMVFAAVPSFAEGEISVIIDGTRIQPVDANGNPAEPFIIDGTTYLPVRAVSEAFKLSVSWDGNTRSVFVGAVVDAELGDEINIYVGGKAFTATDANGTVVYPVNKDGSVFLPIRAIATALGKDVSWDQATKTATISTPADLGGKYYTIKNVGTGKLLATAEFSHENSAALVTVDAAESDEVFWRLGRMGDGIYNVSNIASGKSIDVPSASKDEGTGLIVYTTNGNGNQQWRFTQVSEGVYEISVMHSGLFMDASGEKLVQAAKTGSDYQKWTIEYKGDSMLTKVPESEGFALLSEAEQSGFVRYMFGNLPACYTVANSAESYLTENGYEAASPELQAAMLKTVLAYTAYFQVSGDMLNPSVANYTIVSTSVDEEYDIWRGAKEKCWLYEVEMDGDVPGVIHKFTMVSNEEDSDMVEKMIEALGAYPYAVRQYINRLIWKNGDDANNYNGGGDTIWARLNWKPNTQQIMATIGHELGHILDSNQLEDMRIWSWAEAMDAIPVSGYGSNNKSEDLAELHSLYWKNLGKDTEAAVEVLYPNRVKVLKGLLYRADKAHFADFEQYESFILDIKAKIDAYGNVETAQELDMGQYYSITDLRSGLAWTVENESMDNTARIVLEPYTGRDSQKFSVENFGGLVKFTNKNSGNPVQLHTSAMFGKALTQYGGEWAVDERIELIKAEGGYKMMSKRYGLGVDAMTVGVGDDFVPFVCQNAESAVWKIEAVEKADDVEFYTIGVADTDLALLNGEDGLTIKSGEATKWMLLTVDDAYTIVDTASGEAIDISGGNTAAGAKLITYSLSRNDNQCFYMEKSGNGYLLKMKHSDLYLTYNDDGTVTQEERDASKQQVFTFTAE